MSATTTVRTSQVDWLTLVEAIDRDRRYHQPIVYYFSQGVTKKEPRSPAIYATDE